MECGLCLKASCHCSLDPTALTIVLDTNPESWGAQVKLGASGLPFSAVADSLMLFGSAFLLINKRNQLRVFSAGAARSELVWEPRRRAAAAEGEGRREGEHEGAAEGAAALAGAWAGAEDEGPPPDRQQDFLEGFPAKLKAQLVTAPDAAGGAGGAGGGGGPNLAAALTRAICHIKRAQREAVAEAAASAAPGKLRARILVIMASADPVAQDVQIMNAIFAAGKLDVVVDGLCVQEDSAYLQQATEQTGGVYVGAPRKAGAAGGAAAAAGAGARLQPGEKPLQQLLFHILPDAYSRQFIRLPAAGSLDLRPLCSVSATRLERGRVCSVCLSVFAEEQRKGQCPGCKIEFSGSGHGGGAAAAAAAAGKRRKH